MFYSVSETALTCSTGRALDQGDVDSPVVDGGDRGGHALRVLEPAALVDAWSLITASPFSTGLRSPSRGGGGLGFPSRWRSESARNVLEAKAVGRLVEGVVETVDADPCSPPGSICSSATSSLSTARACRRRTCASAPGRRRSRKQAVVEDGQARSSSPVAPSACSVAALAADLVAVVRGGLVAVVAVGDQQWAAARRSLTAGADRRVADPQTRLTVPSSSVTSPRAPPAPPARPAARVRGAEREDRREVEVVARVARGGRAAARVGALVRAHCCRSRSPDRPGRDPMAAVLAAVGGG